MQNYALSWKKYSNFKQITLDEFVRKFSNISAAFFVQKIDGILGAFVYEKGKESYFVTVNNIVIRDLPVIYEYDSIFNELKDIKEIVLIGELVAVKAGSILPFPQISSVVKTSYREDNKPLVHHYVYDVFSINEKRSKDYKDSLTFLVKTFSNRKSIRIHIPKIVVGGTSALIKVFSSWIEKPGIEGVIARLPDGKNYKIKPAVSVDLAVIGTGHTRMPAWKKKQISYLITAFVDKDGNFRLSSKVGTGFSNKEREDLYKFAEKNYVQELDGEFLLEPKQVIEVKFDRYRFKMMPSFKWEKRNYIKTSSKLSTTLDMPRFARFRDDKEVNEYDVRLTQLVDFPES